MNEKLNLYLMVAVLSPHWPWWASCLALGYIELSKGGKA